MLLNNNNMKRLKLVDLCPNGPTCPCPHHRHHYQNINELDYVYDGDTSIPIDCGCPCCELIPSDFDIFYIPPIDLELTVSENESDEAMRRIKTLPPEMGDYIFQFYLDIYPDHAALLNKKYLETVSYRSIPILHSNLYFSLSSHIIIIDDDNTDLDNTKPDDINEFLKYKSKIINSDEKERLLLYQKRSKEWEIIQKKQDNLRGLYAHLSTYKISEIRKNVKENMSPESIMRYNLRKKYLLKIYDE